jgi:hypothetical protein
MSLTNTLLAIIVAELAALVVITWKRPFFGQIWPPNDHQQQFTLTNYCKWVHEGGRWRVLEDHCAPGFHPGDPPTHPPSYPNQIVRKCASRMTK